MCLGIEESAKRPKIVKRVDKKGEFAMGTPCQNKTLSRLKLDHWHQDTFHVQLQQSTQNTVMACFCRVVVEQAREARL